jgi:hypothetical protein
LSVSISLDDPAAARAWFASVVEPLADSFEPEQVARYVELFGGVLAACEPSLSARELAERYERVRHPRPFRGPDPADVFVLSRVTLGADVAITSVLLDAMKRRFPKARVWFTGSRKGYELFAEDARVRHAGAGYDRVGSIRHRLAASRGLRDIVDGEDAIVVDPDSRLTQLGLVPVCAEDRYYFFETRGSSESGSLADLAARWAERVFGVAGAQPYLAARPAPADDSADITISLGVGENPAKRVPDPFERMLLERLSATGRTALIDRGAGGEESERVVRAAAGLPGIRLFQGSFAAFASRIAASRLYIGYDSAGQHAAAACGVPLITIFAGHPNRRFMERWRPTGPGPVTIVNGEQDASAVVAEVGRALLEPPASPV